MKKVLIFLLITNISVFNVKAQIDAGLFRYPDVSASQIVFTYANDIWIMPKEGGTANRLSSPAGVEMFPKFSPDGKSIAFTGNYDGNKDVYILPVIGGVPTRVTQHGGPDRLVDWTNDGKRLLFASTRESGKSRFNQFYTIPAVGGSADKLPLAFAEFGSYSPDGNRMALVYQSQVFRNWKRYRGGNNGNIILFDFKTLASENISLGSEAADEFPMWNGYFIYFLSDRGAEKKMNLWRYDLTKKAFEQLTKFTENDTRFPSMGPTEIIFEQSGKLYLYQLATQQLKVVNVNLVNDRSLLKPTLQTAEKYVQHANISPDGKRVLVEARGEIFSLPAKEGYVKNITMKSGSAERYPAWSPNGKNIAYWSDASGEYELWLMEAGKESSAKKLTTYGAGFRYNLYWSPDNNKLCFIDKAAQIQIYDLTTNITINVDKGLHYSHGELENFTCSWSADSRWLAYDRDIENQHTALFIFDFQAKKSTQITTGFYSCTNPVFDKEGKYLYCFSTQSFIPIYSDVDNSFIYANTAKLAAISLKNETPSLLAPKNDVVDFKEDKKDDNLTDSSKRSKAEKKKESTKPNDLSKKVNVKPIEINFENIEERLVILPPAAGNLNSLSVAEDKVIYMRRPNTGSTDKEGSLKYYDIEKREEKTIIEGIADYILSANTKKILAEKAGAYAILSPEEGAKFEKPIHLNEMMASVDPVAEWKQIFTEAWRLERDYFYDPNMHGVNWAQVKDRYTKFVDNALSREELDFIIGEMIGELNASHTYHSGGDVEKEKLQTIGYLGVNYEAAGEYYKIKQILKAAPWDAEARSALDAPGTKIKEGDYILAINGMPVTTAKEPYAMLQGLANKTIEVTYNSSPSFNGAKTTLVQTMTDEYRLRNLAWIEVMRKRVSEATNGAAGYIYVPSTGLDGQTELLRQLNAQTDKKALIIDERFNNGGQIPDRFIELLNRTPLAYWAIRDGQPNKWPPNSNFGAKVMLMNGWSGSGGDAFPDYFRKAGLGKLIGTRTWGGLIGISGVPTLMDGGTITVPTFRMYNPDGTWFKEGHGVDPDIEVPEDLTALAKGIDVQLERAITEIKEQLKLKTYQMPAPPAFEVR